jgi:hypothetical protein
VQVGRLHLRAARRNFPSSVNAVLRNKQIQKVKFSKAQKATSKKPAPLKIQWSVKLTASANNLKKKKD